MVNLIIPEMLIEFGIAEEHHKLFMSTVAEDNVIGIELYHDSPNYDIIKSYTIDNSSAIYYIKEYSDWWNEGGREIWRNLERTVYKDIKTCL